MFEGTYEDTSPMPWFGNIAESQVLDADDEGLGRVLELFKSISMGCGGKGGPISLAGPYKCPEPVELIDA